MFPPVLNGSSHGNSWTPRQTKMNNIHVQHILLTLPVKYLGLSSSSILEAKRLPGPFTLYSHQHFSYFLFEYWSTKISKLRYLSGCYALTQATGKKNKNKLLACLEQDPSRYYSGHPAVCTTSSITVKKERAILYMTYKYRVHELKQKRARLPLSLVQK